MVRGIKCKAIVLYEQLEAMKPDDKIDKPMKDLQKVLCNARTKIKRMLADKNLDLRGKIEFLITIWEEDEKTLNDDLY